jgi:hypothetical protein
MSSGVLADEIAKICTKSHIGCSALLKSPCLNWDSLQKDESLALHQIVLDIS